MRALVWCCTGKAALGRWGLARQRSSRRRLRTLYFERAAALCALLRRAAGKAELTRLADWCHSCIAAMYRRKSRHAKLRLYQCYSSATGEYIIRRLHSTTTYDYSRVYKAVELEALFAPPFVNQTRHADGRAARQRGLQLSPHVKGICTPGDSRGLPRLPPNSHKSDTYGFTK